MGKFLLLGLVLMGFSDGIFAALPANAWYFSSTFRETVPDAHRDFDHESGAQYQFGRTLGRLYALDFGFQDQEFTHKSEAATTAQTIYNFSIRRFFGAQNLQWFLVGEAGQIVSKLQGNKVSSNNVGLGLGVQHTVWKEGPSLSADLRFRVDYDSESDPAFTQYNDWIFAFSLTIPFFNKNKVMRAAMEAAGQDPGQVDDQAVPAIAMLTTPSVASPAVVERNPAETSKLESEQQEKTAVSNAEPKNMPLQKNLAAKASGPDDTAQATVKANGQGGKVNSPVVTKNTSSKNEVAKKATTTANQSTADPKQEEIKKTIARGIDKLRAEITALEDEEEIEKADFSTEAFAMNRNQDKRNKKKIEQKMSQSTFADKKTDADLDGVVDFADQCSETPLGAPVNLTGCALDTDGDKVIDLIDLCNGTPTGVSVDERGCGFDDDLDGVPNHRDRCEDTVEDISVNADGCELDTDNDGVVDSKDQCEGTTPGVVAEITGCHITDVIVLKAKHFQPGSTILNDSAKNVLEKIYETIQQYPDMRVELTGNANDPRISEYSKRISVGRANSAKLYLLELGADAEVMDYGAFSTDPSLVKAIKATAADKDRPEDRRVNMRLVEVE